MSSHIDHINQKSIVFCVALAGCGAPASQLPASSYQLAELATRIAAGVSPGLKAQVAAASFSSYYQSLLAATSDTPFTVGGQTVAGVHGRVEAAAADFAQLDRAYASLGASGGFTPTQQTLEVDEIATVMTAMLRDFGEQAGAFVQAPRSLEVIWRRASAPARVRFSSGPKALINLSALFAMAWAKQIAVPTSLDLTAALPGGSAVAKQQDSCGSSSGTFVNHCQMVTAAHAVIGQTGLRSCQPGGHNVAAISVVANQRFTGSIDTAQWDVAVVTFPDNTSTQWVEPNFSPLTPGAQVNAASHPLGGEGRCQTAQVDSVYETGLLSINGLSVVGLPGGSGGYVGDGQLRGVLSASNDATNPSETFVAPMSENEDFIRQNTIPTN